MRYCKEIFEPRKIDDEFADSQTKCPQWCIWIAPPTDRNYNYSRTGCGACSNAVGFEEAVQISIERKKPPPSAFSGCYSATRDSPLDDQYRGCAGSDRGGGFDDGIGDISRETRNREAADKIARGGDYR